MNCCILVRKTYDGVRRVSGLRRDPAVSSEDPQTDPHIPLKNRLRPSHQNSVRVANYFKLQITRTELLREGRRRSLFFFGGMCSVWICVGSSAETAGSLLHPETRRTPSYTQQAQNMAKPPKPTPGLGQSLIDSLPHRNQYNPFFKSEIQRHINSEFYKLKIYFIILHKFRIL